ncbi:PhzF family phenazine biosynthesis protein [Sandarakinorhabdus sp.]|uniref:PhzF family phenazine biosynthesis protein n=1 Tax=Sandarakinorhabdus sp. TaxID=1916663 RepID=UPI00286DE115|nr:PhzF family phenazine biosynthesis protein [Sandarakinorhabdus sp.]
MRLPFTQIDAFADAPFSGNPAAVMPLTAWLPDAVLQAIAEENNLSETAFLVPCPDPETAEFDLRWFTPALEVTLCGHATLASGHLILTAMPDLAEVRFSTNKSGVLTVSRDAGGYALALPSLPAADAADADLLAAVGAALGAMPGEVWRRGEDYLMAVFADVDAVTGLKPDFRAVVALAPGIDLMLIATAPGTDSDIVSRVFVPAAGIDEDPVTGSAHAVLAPYWTQRLGRSNFTAVQASRRGGRIGCRLAGDRVILTGRCRTVIEGEYILG